MIINAKDTQVIGAYNNLPQMGNTIKSWFVPITFEQVTRTKQGTDWVETLTPIETQGVVQKLKGTDLMIYPEGERGWDWREVHCLPNLILAVNEFVVYKGVRYKVRKTKNFTEYGYVMYHLQEAYQ